MCWRPSTAVTTSSRRDASTVKLTDWARQMASGPGDVAQPHQGDPAQAAGLDQLRPTGTHRVAVDRPRPDLGATTPFQGFVDAEDQGAVAAVQMLEQQRQQDAGYRTGRPHCPIEHLMVAGVVVIWLGSMTRSAAATVRWPGVRIAPTNSSWALRQVGLVNSVAKGTRTATMASGSRPAYPVLILFLNYAQSLEKWRR